MKFRKKKFLDLDSKTQLLVFTLFLSVLVNFFQQYYIQCNSNITIVMPSDQVFELKNGVATNDKYLKAFSDYIIAKMFDQRGDLERVKKNFSDIKVYLSPKVAKELEAKLLQSVATQQEQSIDSFFEPVNTVIDREKGITRTLGYRVDKFFNKDEQRTKILVAQKWYMEGLYPKLVKIAVEIKNEE